MLFDEVHEWTHHGGTLEFSGPRRKAWESSCIDLRMTLRRARRFTLDDAFTREVVRRATVQAPKMLSLCHLANLPFDRVWLEYNMNARIDGQLAMGTGPERHGEERGPAAFLIERHNPANPAMYRISHYGYHLDERDGVNRLDQGSPCGPCGYVVDLEGMLPYLAGHPNEPRGVYGDRLPTIPKELPTARVREVEDKMRAMGWGYFREAHDGTLEYMTIEALTRRGGVCIEGRFFSIVTEEGIVRDSRRRDGRDRNSNSLLNHFANDVMEGRGNLRFVMAALATMNVAPVTYIHREAKGFYRKRLRNIPYLDSHTVTIHCGRKRIETIVDHAFREHELAQRRKRHEVRGHWALAEYAPRGRRTVACVHEPAERDGDYAICGKCERLIHWRDHFERGDASLGFVQHDYEVKP